MHTHYDNLKVTRNAPLPVIKAAYRALSQLYHPDRNHSPDADRVMRILNDAWTVLSDETRRAEYDRKLAEKAASDRGSRPMGKPMHAEEQRDRGFATRQTAETAAQRTRATSAPQDAPRPVGEKRRQWKMPVSLLLALCALATLLFSASGFL